MFTGFDPDQIIFAKRNTIIIGIDTIFINNQTNPSIQFWLPNDSNYFDHMNLIIGYQLASLGIVEIDEVNQKIVLSITGDRKIIKAIEIFLKEEIPFYPSQKNPQLVQKLSKFLKDCQERLKQKPQKLPPLKSELIMKFGSTFSNPTQIKGLHNVQRVIKKNSNTFFYFKDNPSGRMISNYEVANGRCYRLLLGNRHPQVISLIDSDGNRAGSASQEIHQFIPYRVLQDLYFSQGKSYCQTKDKLLKAETIKVMVAAYIEKENDLNLGNFGLNAHGQAVINYRQHQSELNSIELSELLISCAIFLEDFLALFFNIQEALAISQIKTTSYNPISVFKKYFVLRRAKKELNKVENLPPLSELNTWLEIELSKASIQAEDKELMTALLATNYLENDETENIEQLVKWCTRCLAEEPDVIKDWVSFSIPERLDYANLVPTHTVNDDPLNRQILPPHSLRERDGFKLTDERMNAKAIQDEVNYCIYCHDHEGDFCSKGFPVKKGDPNQGLKKNPLGLVLTGCPLDEKISEMHFLKKEGHTIASLAMIMIDNPMCPATGHRICNDCMKACIYQKQDPVNIPQIETRVLIDALNLPWGVEIYDLLTRWHPLRKEQYVMKPYNGLKVMIAGMGPAGFTLAHHLLLEGFAVVGFDGLKIEPLAEQLIAEPIYRFDDLKESLDERLMSGFGGVAEYGITVRWDKNFLKLIYLSLKRKPYFQVFGNTRFGGTVTVETAWEMGFDHFVIAVGAGLPKALPIPGSLAPGMRQANDFLMALQLGNAAKSNSLTNLQIRLPAVVIGGGLTGVDTATEIQAYYIRLVEKTLARYTILVEKNGRGSVDATLDSASREILAEYLAHAKTIQAERELAKSQKRLPQLIPLLRSFGGVTIAYRRSMQESPAYIHNHEELQKALEEGIYYGEHLEPISVELDGEGQVKALTCRQTKTGEIITLPARSILVATGTQPNIAYEFEHRGTFNRLHLQYQHYEENDNELTIAHGVSHCKDPQFGPFTSYHHQDRRVSLIGDTHPVFHGSVVKAIASGMRTYPKIIANLKNKFKKGDPIEYQQFADHIHALFTARLVEMNRKTPHTLELTIKAPLSAKQAKPGQFFRLQNFETNAKQIANTLLQMEPLALVPAEIDKQNGHLTFIVNENTASSKLCAFLKPNELISLMGPTGVRTKIPEQHESILIIGEPTSFAFVRSVGSALRTHHNHVLYLLQANTIDEIHCQTQLENAADVIIWQIKQERLKNQREQDFYFQGQDILQTFKSYAEQKHIIALQDIDRIYVVGGTALLRYFQMIRKRLIQDYFLKDPKVYASVYGNMQCMLKGVCAQCLQWQIDPETGLRTKAVFTCSWQDQPLEMIDIDHLDERGQQNRLVEHLNHLWVKEILT